MATAVFYIHNETGDYIELSIGNDQIWLKESSGEGMELGEAELYKLLREYYDGNF